MKNVSPAWVPPGPPSQAPTMLFSMQDYKAGKEAKPLSLSLSLYVCVCVCLCVCAHTMTALSQ